METQFYAGQGAVLQTLWGQPLRIDHLGGEFTVRSGQVWVTRRGDTEDHVLEAGQRIVLKPADAAVIEQWRRDLPAVIDWTPRLQPRRALALPRTAAALGLRALAFAAGAAAFGLRRAEAGFAALARSAAAMAKRAQGCICAGDSIASAGTLQ